MAANICSLKIVCDLPVLNPTQGTRILWGLIQFEEATLGLGNYSVVDWLEILKELGHIGWVNVDCDMETKSRLRCHGDLVLRRE